MDITTLERSLLPSIMPSVFLIVQLPLLFGFSKLMSLWSFAAIVLELMMILGCMGDANTSTSCDSCFGVLRCDFVIGEKQKSKMCEISI